MPIPVEVQVQPDTHAKAPADLPSGPLQATLYDISEYGIGLLMEKPLSWGVVVAMEFSRAALPVHPDAAQPAGRIRIVGRVIHAIPHHLGRYRVGVSFTRMEESDRALIRRMGSPPPAPQPADRRRVSRVLTAD